jgi:hypothetical protein
MEKNATPVCLHHFTGFPRDLNQHLIQLKIQADQLTQFEQGVKLMNMSLLGLLPGPIFASANHLPPIAFATVVFNELHRIGSLFRYLLPIGKTTPSVK